MIKHNKKGNGKELYVKDHKKFCCFDYVSKPNDNCLIGQILYKASEKAIGVVIQTHGDGEFRTDMWGNSHESEVRFATRGEIEKYRPDLVNDIW